MSDAERYVREVLVHVPAAFPERRARIAADLRSHLAESVEAGESEAGAVRRMGDPEQVAATFLDGAPLVPAAPSDRLGAYLFDNTLFVTPVLAALALLAMNDAGRVAALRDPATPADQLIVAAIGIGSVAFSLLYFPLFETRSGQTPGKRLFGIAVVKASGTAVRLGAALLRRLPSFFSFALLDALFVPFTARRQRAFDMVAGTVVVRASLPPRRGLAWVMTGVLVLAAAAATVTLVSATPGGMAALQEAGD
ncbi:MAG TPA: RDD family protein [Longimicrobium sp.]|jgi:uncharacterized RDD family membrane protein YckC